MSCSSCSKEFLFLASLMAAMALAEKLLELVIPLPGLRHITPVVFLKVVSNLSLHQVSVPVCVFLLSVPSSGLSGCAAPL